jgi:RNA polymerase sigma factor (TIGR02999 family)
MARDANNRVTEGEVVTWSTQLHDELCLLARAYLAKQPPGCTLQSSDLVHEAWLRLAASKQGWQSRSHFMGAAAQAMRCVLIDQARRDATIRHGAGWTRVELSEGGLADGAPDDMRLAIDEVLDRFTTHHAAESELVKLRYFEGLTLKEAAAALGITQSAAKRYWAYSRAWLCREMQKSGRPQTLRA